MERCYHLQKAVLPKHSTVKVTVVPPEENTTDYRDGTECELCTYCSGVIQGTLLRLKEKPRVENLVIKDGVVQPALQPAVGGMLPIKVKHESDE